MQRTMREWNHAPAGHQYPGTQDTGKRSDDHVRTITEENLQNTLKSLGDML